MDDAARGLIRDEFLVAFEGITLGQFAEWSGTERLIEASLRKAPEDVRAGWRNHYMSELFPSED